MKARKCEREKGGGERERERAVSLVTPFLMRKFVTFRW